MIKIMQKVDLNSTFSKLEVGESVSIPFTFATETNIRSAASRYGKKYGVKLKVKAPLGSEYAIVTMVK